MPSTPASLPRPGVQVIQQFTATAATVITPTLVPNIVGACTQTVPLLVTSASGGQTLNNDAHVVLPAFFFSAVATGSPPVYTGLNGLQLALSINESQEIDVVFSDPTSSGLTPATVVSQITTAFQQQNVTSAQALSTNSTTFELATLGTGQFESIVILSDTSPVVAAAFGIGIGKTYTGIGYYDQYNTVIPEQAFPDPMGNLSQLAIEQDSVRVFLSTGNGTDIVEATRTASFLLNGQVAIAGSVETSTDISVLSYQAAPVVAASPAPAATNITSSGGTLTVTGGTSGFPTSGTIHVPTAAGSVVVTYTGTTSTQFTGCTGGNGTTQIPTAGGPVTNSTPNAFGTTTLIVNVDGAAYDQTVTFANPLSDTAALAQIQAGLSGATPSLVSTKYLEITSNSTGTSSSIIIRSTSTALVTNGGPINFTQLSGTGTSIAAISDGSGGAYTSLLQFAGANFTTAATQATITASAAPTFTGLGGLTLVISDGNQPQTITFTGSETTITGTTDSLEATIQSYVGLAAGGQINVSATSGKLTLTTENYGNEAMIEIIGGTALALLESGSTTPTLIAGAEVRGNPFPPQVGDQLWIDGSLFANISKVAPGGIVTNLKVNTQVPISADVGTHYFIEAQNLVSPAPSNRPTPDLIVDLTDNIQIKNGLLRDFAGNVINVTAPLYVTYTALRLDTTALATNPGLLTFANTTDLGNAIPPIDATNPLALGMYFALINAPGINVTGLGVDEINDDAPFGTVEAFTRAAEFLEGFEVYAIAILTHDESVAQVFNTHVQFMSEPTSRGERIVLWNPSLPTNALPTLVTSGTNGDGLSTIVFDTKVASLSTLIQAAGITPVGTIPVTAGLYLNLAVDGMNYSIQSISGSQVTVRTTSGNFPNGTNNDDFYAENVLPLPLIAETFSVQVRGLPLLTLAGTPDYNAIAANVNTLGTSFSQRRFWMTVPDRCVATVGGVSQIIDGFYMNCATVGAIGQQPPQQSFTNFPITGFTGVLGSDNIFSEAQLDVMAGGGAYIYVQDASNAPVYARMALTTDLTSVETRTDSVTKVVDFTAKFMRGSLKNFIGRFNITQGFLDSLGTVVQGLFGFLTESGVLIGGTMNSIIQDTDAPDMVLISAVLDVPVPVNYISLTLLV
jgi:hypothetical protein